MKRYTDKGLKYNFEMVVRNESKRQIDKWGIQTHSMFEWLTYTAEELGELAQAISECSYRKGSPLAVFQEAVQVATLALKIAEMIEGDM